MEEVTLEISRRTFLALAKTAKQLSGGRSHGPWVDSAHVQKVTSTDCRPRLKYVFPEGAGEHPVDLCVFTVPLKGGGQGTARLLVKESRLVELFRNQESETEDE